jgi:hypothetical protein
MDGGYNLYAMVGNAPVGRWDLLGQDRYITQFGKDIYSIHVGVAVDIWECRDGRIYKIGQKTYHFSVNWQSFTAIVTGVMLNMGEGKVTPMKGLQLENPLTIPSDPFQDTLFMEYLEKQIKNPPIYGSLGNNCVFWSVAVLQIGMDYNIKDQIDGNVPIDDIPMPQSPPHGTPPRKNVQGEYRYNPDTGKGEYYDYNAPHGKPPQIFDYPDAPHGKPASNYDHYS